MLKLATKQQAEEREVRAHLKQTLNSLKYCGNPPPLRQLLPVISAEGSGEKTSQRGRPEERREMGGGGKEEEGAEVRGAGGGGVAIVYRHESERCAKKRWRPRKTGRGGGGAPERGKGENRGKRGGEEEERGGARGPWPHPHECTTLALLPPEAGD